MAQDKYSAVWVSHSSMGDFLKCPRAYYLHNMYKSPRTGRKINIVNPALALGQAVHEAVESLALIPAESRFDKPLIERFEEAWAKVSGKRGGFLSEEDESAAKERGAAMIRLVSENPGPLRNKIIRFAQDLPHYYLSEDDNIILCGKVDWLEYLPETDSVHVIDFKTGRHEEKEDSLQLPIYQLILSNCQKRKATKASYWYLDRDAELTEKALPPAEEAYRRVYEVARRVKEARETGQLACQRGGCFACRPYEAIVDGEAEYIGVGAYNQDLFMLKAKTHGEEALVQG